MIIFTDKIIQNVNSHLIIQVSACITYILKGSYQSSVQSAHLQVIQESLSAQQNIIEIRQIYSTSTKDSEYYAASQPNGQGARLITWNLLVRILLRPIIFTSTLLTLCICAIHQQFTTSQTACSSPNTSFVCVYASH
ncbi:Hypothetical_protein [Hexamita inflata]|uniref:Hypothetical_protein n=1 Tax=Hexamita inflata TaxID=28002 RepID=A0AA86UUI3_9EUKA|nr:Hypothetical protein HINF_LOCUS59940 [Hexamita inflata]